jgi:hypothetical protein
MADACRALLIMIASAAVPTASTPSLKSFLFAECGYVMTVVRARWISAECQAQYEVAAMACPFVETQTANGLSHDSGSPCT